MKIIDIHVHPRIENPGILDDIVATARQYEIERICLLGDVLAYGYDPDQDRVRYINDNTIDSIQRYPEMLFGFCHVNPNNDEGFIREEIRRCIIERGLKGIKLEVSTNARDSRLDPVMAMARELSIPVLHHAWYKTVNKAFNESDPGDIADLAARFPDVPIIMAHITGCRIRGILDIAGHKNVYVDTSGSQPETGLVEYAVRSIGPERLLYGSDVPGRDFSSQLGRILGGSLSARDERLILYENAKKLFAV